MKHILLLGWCLVFATSAFASSGKDVYMSYGCAVCHGKEGRGDGINAKNFNPPPTDFYNPQAYHHGNDAQSISYIITNGVREGNSNMPAFEHITGEELKQLVDYLVSLQRSKS